MAQNSSPSMLDPTQIFQRSFEEANDNLRVNVVATTAVEQATAADGGALPALVKVAGGYDGTHVHVLHTNTSGVLETDGSGYTQPVSGTVTANQGTSPWVTSGTVSVIQPTGTNLHTVVDSGTVAASQSGTWNITNVSGTVSLPTGAATESTLSTLNAKSAAALVPTAFDYVALTYDGSGNVQTATYKTGGSGGSTVATLTLAYNGSNQLTSVTKT